MPDQNKAGQNKQQSKVPSLLYWYKLPKKHLLNVFGQDVGYKKQQFGIDKTTNKRRQLDEEVYNAKSIMKGSKM